MKFSGSNQIKFDDFFFYSYWALCKLHKQEDGLSLILVLCLSCPAVFCVVADSLHAKTPSQFPRMQMAARFMTDKNSDSYKSKIALKISGYGNLEQGKPATFATVGTQALTLFLWIISVPQLEI